MRWRSVQGVAEHRRVGRDPQRQDPRGCTLPLTCELQMAYAAGHDADELEEALGADELGAGGGVGVDLGAEARVFGDVGRAAEADALGGGEEAVEVAEAGLRLDLPL